MCRPILVLSRQIGIFLLKGFRFYPRYIVLGVWEGVKNHGVDVVYGCAPFTENFCLEKNLFFLPQFEIDKVEKPEIGMEDVKSEWNMNFSSERPHENWRSFFRIFIQDGDFCLAKIKRSRFIYIPT